MTSASRCGLSKTDRKSAHVGERGIERLLPPNDGSRDVRDLHQLGVDPHSAHPARALSPPDAAEKQVADTELPTDLLRMLDRVSVLVGAGAGDHLEASERGELAPDLVRHAIGEVAPSRIAEVLKR